MKKAKKESKRRTQRKPRPRFMSIREGVAFMDRFASEHVPDDPAEVNLALLARTVQRILTTYGKDVRDPVQLAAKWMTSGAKSTKGRHGRPPTDERLAVRDAIASLRQRHPSWTWEAVTAEVAKLLGIPTKQVRRGEKTKRW